MNLDRDECTLGLDLATEHAQFVKMSGHAQFVRKSGHAQFVKTSGHAQIVKTSGHAQFVRTSGQAQFVGALDDDCSSWDGGHGDTDGDGRVDEADTMVGGEVECGMGMGHCSMQSVMQIPRPCTMQCHAMQEKEKERDGEREREN